MAISFPYKTKRKYSESDGINADDSWYVECDAIAKSPSDVSPYLVANEWIAANIAWFLRLPIPPFTLMGEKRRDKLMFGSYRYDGDKKVLVPSDGSVLYQRFPDTCTGIVLFDILIANKDRNSRNIKVDKPDKPKRFYIIDHERSLFYLYPEDGANQLAAAEDRLGITDGTFSDDEFHCLIGELDSIDHVLRWIEKIQDLPDWFIDEICLTLPSFTINKAERTAVCAFLKRRRDKISELVFQNKERFPKIKQWQLFL
ncbi:MAG: hypothetical protein SH868_17930 [Bythopirellula sp.]|nr:hypothetical protein [Bythopirellula sp.]